MSYSDIGKITCIAGEALATKRRVKIDTATVTTPPTVVYADAGEAALGVTEYAVASGDNVEIRLLSEGTWECTAAGALTTPGLTLYGAADGKVSKTSSGTAVGVNINTATAANSIVECTAFPYTSTTAATVSIADAGAHTGQATVEAALQEIYNHLDDNEFMIPIDLSSVRLENGTVLTAFVSAAAATPGFSQISNKELVLRWNNHATPGDVIFTTVLPNTLDRTAGASVHWLASVTTSQDTPEITHEVFFNAGDTDCAGTDDEIDGGTTLTEYSSSILSGDIPTPPAHMTCVFHPKDGELGNADCYVYAVWLEYTGKLLS